MKKVTAIIEIQDAEKIIFHDNSYPVYFEFDRSNILGTGKVKKEDGKLIAEMVLNKNIKKHNELFPAIGYRVDKKEFDAELQKETLIQGTLMAIGLSRTRNVDESIEPIRTPQK